MNSLIFIVSIYFPISIIVFFVYKRAHISRISIIIKSCYCIYFFYSLHRGRFIGVLCAVIKNQRQCVKIIIDTSP